MDNTHPFLLKKGFVCNHLWDNCKLNRNLLKIPTGRRLISWIFTKHGGVESGTIKRKSISVVAGRKIWTWDLRIPDKSSALGHDASMVRHTIWAAFGPGLRLLPRCAARFTMASIFLDSYFDSFSNNFTGCKTAPTFTLEKDIITLSMLAYKWVKGLNQWGGKIRRVVKFSVKCSLLFADLLNVQLWVATFYQVEGHEAKTSTEFCSVKRSRVRF